MYAPTLFGVMLKDCRESAGISQSELAAELGKTAQYISNIEKGKNNSPPDESDLLKLIARLGLTGDDAEKFRLFAYADRGMLPPEMFRYVFDSPTLIGLIRSAMERHITSDYWLTLLNALPKGM